MKTNLLCKHALLVVGIASSQTLFGQYFSETIYSSDFSETIYSYDFGYDLKNYIPSSTKIPTSDTYIDPDSGINYIVFIGNDKVTPANNTGSIRIDNPGTTLGFGSEIQIQSTQNESSPNKFGIFKPSNVPVSYMKAKVRTTSAGDGSLAISIGNNLLGAANKIWTTEVGTAIAFIYIDYVGGNLAGVYRGNKTTPIVSVNGKNFTKDTNQVIEIYANNYNSPYDYNRGGVIHTLNKRCWDLWLDGEKMSYLTFGGWISVGLGQNGNLQGISFSARGNLPSNSTYLYVDDVQHMYGLPSENKFYNGAWSDGFEPHAAKSLILASDYSGPDFEAKDLTINAGVTLTVNGTIKVSDVINNGHIIVADNANFIQALGFYKAGPNSTFTVNRSSESVKDKYAFWSSPVVGQNMFAIFPTLPQYVMTYNTLTDYYTTLSNPANSIAGVGYSIKTPSFAPAVSFGNNISNPPTPADPNNYLVTTPLELVGEKYNLVGNPFPSNLDLSKFYKVNKLNISSTLWFWDNKSNSVKTQSGSTTVNVGYATYNLEEDPTWNPAPSSDGNTAIIPDGSAIKIGQAFIVQALKGNITFDNNMRVTDGSNVTFNKNIIANASEGKYWLKLSTPYNTSVTQAVTYQSGGSNDYDSYDSPAMGLGSDAFYSFAGAEKVIIQGKAPFNVDDVVLLGNKHFETGDFVISLAKTKGLFETGQAIYLRDKLLGTYTNLQNDFYMLSSAAGDFGNRFEIVYKQGTLGSDNSLKSELQVYRVGDDFIIDSASQINAVKVYDVSGRLLQSIAPNSEKSVVKNLSKGVFILQITTASERVTKKIIK